MHWHPYYRFTDGVQVAAVAGYPKKRRAKLRRERRAAPPVAVARAPRRRTEYAQLPPDPVDLGPPVARYHGLRVDLSVPLPDSARKKEIDEVMEIIAMLEGEI